MVANRMNGSVKTGPWLVVGSADALARLKPLLNARRKRQPVVTILCAEDETWVPTADQIPAETEGVLVVGPPSVSPRRGLPGLWLHDRTGRKIPVGWLPNIGDGLAVYAKAAARVLRRSGNDRALVVLGQWEDRFLRVSLRTQRWLEKHGEDAPGFLWTADRISRPDMLDGLALGPAVAMYFGHGRPRGWAGYHGVRLAHFERDWPEPTGALLAVCCENASRWRTGISFAERVVLQGVAGAMFAAVKKTKHEDNRRWGPALCEAYTEHHPETLADLVRLAEVPDKLKDAGPWRFIGDPLMPLAGATGVSQKATRVFAPAADEALPGW